MAVESSTALALVPQEEDSVSQATSLLPCSRKRRRRRTELESEEEEEEEEGIKKLPDVLLMDILCRLGLQRAFQCKSVSKHWNSLISHPYFVHHRHCHRNRHSDSEGLLIVLTIACYVQALVTAKSSLELFNLLKFLPFPEHHLSIYASFNDLLLVRNFIPLRLDLSLQFIICNPLTRQWLAIPPIFSEDYRLGGERDILVGLIICQQENYPYGNRYKVVRIHCPFETTTTTQIKMEIFSSETGEWCNLFVESPRVLNPCNSISRQAGVFPCNGMLHWVDADQEFVKGFLVYDPFNDIGHLRYIDPPVEMNFSPADLVFFGGFRGRLRIIQCSHTPFYNWVRPRLYCFSVWELEDYANAGTWCLKCIIKFYDIVSQCPRVGRPVINFLAFHTNVAELVLFQIGKDILWYNVHTKVLKEIGKLPVEEEFSNVRPPIFLLGYQSWPTPIPRRPLELE